MTVNRLSVVALLVAGGLALAGCGRKTNLEPPPSASAAPPAQVAGQPSLGEPDHPALEGERQAPAIARPFTRNNSFFLDFLIAGERPDPLPQDTPPRTR